MERIFTMEDKEVLIAPPKVKNLENLDEIKKSLDKKEEKSAGGGGGKSKGGGGGKSKSYPGAKPLKAGKVQAGGVVIAKIPSPPKVEIKPPEKEVEKEKVSKEKPKDNMAIDVGSVFSELKAEKDNDFGIVGKAKKHDEVRRKIKDEPERTL